MKKTGSQYPFFSSYFHLIFEIFPNINKAKFVHNLCTTFGTFWSCVSFKLRQHGSGSGSGSNSNIRLQRPRLLYHSCVPSSSAPVSEGGGMSPLTLPRAPPGEWKAPPGELVLVLLSCSLDLRSPMRSPPLGGAASVLLRCRTGLRPAPSTPPALLMDSRRPRPPAGAGGLPRPGEGAGGGTCS